MQQAVAHDATTAASAGPQLTLARRIGYGVGDMGGSMMATITGFFLYAFLLDVAGLRPAAIGLIFLITNIWDALIDPSIGAWSDRTRSRWGRKRVWLLLGAVPAGLAYVLHWVVPPLGETGLFVYYLLIALLLKTAFSAVGIPYMALAAVMATTYQQRIQINTTRSILNIIASLLAIILHPIVVGLAGDDVQRGHLYSAALIGCFVVLSTLTAFAASFERDEQRDDPPPASLLHELTTALRNRPFLLATGMFLCSWLVLFMVQNNLQLYIRYWVRAEDAFQGIILTFQISVIVALALWGLLARRMEKRTVYVVGMLVWASGLLMLYIGPRDDPTLYYGIAAWIGLGVAVAYIIPWSMLPDTVDYDELQSGQRRYGTFYGLFVLLQQIGLSLGLAASGFALEAAGYLNPEGLNQPVSQPASVEQTLRVLVSLVPASILLASIPLALIYPITRARFAAIQRQLAERRGTHTGA
ncbi:MAG: MFS transporter [Chloroflexaceae bacterium]|jgi:GPH family glycoside/pentoside/hexuronide:cation symporter|nr:MFS transporter [Chloroflexaceae bacterium]